MEVEPAGRVRNRGRGVLAMEQKSAGDVIGYCGLVCHGNGAPDEPELAYELLRRAHGFGYATETGGAVVTWASEAKWAPRRPLSRYPAGPTASACEVASRP